MKSHSSDMHGIAPIFSFHVNVRGLKNVFLVNSHSITDDHALWAKFDLVWKCVVRIALVKNAARLCVSCDVPPPEKRKSRRSASRADGMNHQYREREQQQKQLHWNGMLHSPPSPANLIAHAEFSRVFFLQKFRAASTPRSISTWSAATPATISLHSHLPLFYAQQP